MLTCGHGRGGRLGHGTEQSVVVRGGVTVGGCIHVHGRAEELSLLKKYNRLISACSPTTLMYIGDLRTYVVLL